MILVTGGAGFIGSHTCVELLNRDYEIVIVDNLVNSKFESVEAVKQITGKDCIFYELDINNEEGMRDVFRRHDISSVIHFAGLKAVGESCENPHRYYSNNIGGSKTDNSIALEIGALCMKYSDAPVDLKNLLTKRWIRCGNHRT